MPAARCKTFGSDDFIRVPFPAARMTTKSGAEFGDRE
jgi:hypothetical protein